MTVCRFTVCVVARVPSFSRFTVTSRKFAVMVDVSAVNFIVSWQLFRYLTKMSSSDCP